MLSRHIGRGGVINLLAAADIPEVIAALGEDGIRELLRSRSPRLAKTLPMNILAALAEQTVIVAGTAAFGRIITGVAAQLRDVRLERDQLAAEPEARLEAHPLAGVLTPMPGVGVRTTIKILTIVGDGPEFPTATHLASYAGLAPVTHS